MVAQWVVVGTPIVVGAVGRGHRWWWGHSGGPWVRAFGKVKMQPGTWQVL